jgi:hypothetical protein
MNQFTILVLVLVVFCYCGGKYCPSVLKQNKQILLGIVGGLVLASFFGMRLEGMDPKPKPKARTKGGDLVEITSEHDNTQCCALKNEMELQGVAEMWNSVIRPTDCAQDIQCP